MQAQSTIDRNPNFIPSGPRFTGETGSPRPAEQQHRPDPARAGQPEADPGAVPGGQRLQGAQASHTRQGDSGGHAISERQDRPVVVTLLILMLVIYPHSLAFALSI